MDNVRLTYLLQLYLSGTCSKEEESEFLQYITENDDAQVNSLLNTVWRNPSDELSPEQQGRILKQILSHGNVISRTHKKKDFTWLKIAASLVLVMLFGFGSYRLFFSDQPDSVVSTIADHNTTHQFIKLPDGSTALLNEGSTLKYPDSFSGQSSREVSLIGEAFFDIVHDPAKPFVVHTGKLSTTVLGTSFNVKAYDEDDDITITVTRGKVKVSDDKKVLGVITPDQQITFFKNTQRAQQQVVKASDVVAWTDKDIYFDDVSMKEAIKRLEDRFHVQITFENEKIKDCRFTATFLKGEDLIQILDVICEFNRVKYVKDDTGNIEISGNGCSPDGDNTNLN